ncbi:cob(I)yrinic acid a,c-diamide adenosyltransferase [Thermosipho atlanticus]|uniref:Corrinoid adenosyltransferase n=1 Tax=Thermosipho atlanticus DSM 15807 TaxID=1123380 RepID=A0A1M5SQB5_9BACT|nr:cob(I)yrinic acid a,c-diamide adenosyltransferase [Thermosipho atlanticus]SHH40764.1 ATP:cob(I)alamin adenosyltransferase [Thermosipho atlanticus DSM 15807]
MISTKTGDNGKTSLANGERVDKDNLRVEVYGVLDELNSYLGLAKQYLDEKEKDVIEDIQRTIFRLSSELAKGERFVKLIDINEIEKLTILVEKYEKTLNLKGFILPGSNFASAILDICRTIARRAERRIVSLSKNENVRKEILAYINRLSDLLFVIARYVEKDNIKYV